MSEQPEDGTVLSQLLSAKETEPDRDITEQSVVTHHVDTETTGETSTKHTNTQQ